MRSGYNGAKRISPLEHFTRKSSLFMSQFPPGLGANGKSWRCVQAHTQLLGDPCGKSWIKFKTLCLGSSSEISIVLIRNEIGTGEGTSTSFLDWTQQRGLIDLGYNVLRFTWNQGNTRQRRPARLDRALCDVDWRRVFLSMRHTSSTFILGPLSNFATTRKSSHYQLMAETILFSSSMVNAYRFHTPS